MSKYYRTIVTVEVLTADEPADFNTLADLHYQITDGDASGDWDVTSEEVTMERMRELLVAQGSDPDFLGLGDDENQDTR